MWVHAGVAVHFCVPYQAAFGEELAVVGNQPYLGDWDPQSPAVMTWAEGAEGDTWTYDATVLEDTTLEYKYVRRSAGEVVWEGGGNRVLPVDTSKMASVAIKDLWEHQELSEVAVTAAGEPAAEPDAGTAAPEAPAQVPALVQKEEVGGNGVHAAPKAAPVSATREMVVATVSAIADAPPVEAAAAPAPPAAEEAVAEAARGPVAPEAAAEAAPEAAPEEAVEAAPAQEGPTEQGHAGQPCEYLGVALTDVRAMMEKEPGIVLLPYDDA